MMACSFPHLLQAFFQDWMGGQRHLSRHTVLSYRDTWRLFLRFVASRKERAVAQLTLTDLSEAEVLAFLRYCEQDRHTSIGTRNCRLAALRAFFRFVTDREPTVADDCAAILRIPTKRASKPALCYLDEDEVAAITGSPIAQQSRASGTTLSFIPVQHGRTDSRVAQCVSERPATGTAHAGATRGKRSQGTHLSTLARNGRSDPRVAAPTAAHTGRTDFRQPVWAPLGSRRVRFKLRHYVQRAAQQVTSLTSKHVTPHTFRHSVAVALVSAEVDVTVIRSWLGHAHLDTTNHYARATLETKRAALERVDRSARPGKPPRWKRNPELLTWLDAL
jgi:site-specific recombinase XerD